MKRKCTRLSHKQYQFLYRLGRKHVGKHITVFYCFSGRQGKRLGITISRKWGTAPERNRFKRIVRAAYASLYKELPEQCAINVHPRVGFTSLKMDTVKRELHQLIQTRRA